MRPSRKSPKMEQFLEGLNGRTSAISGGYCTNCGQPVTDFDDWPDAYQREYGISGFCKYCQDQIFGSN